MVVSLPRFRIVASAAAQRKVAGEVVHGGLGALSCWWGLKQSWEDREEDTEEIIPDESTLAPLSTVELRSLILEIEGGRKKYLPPLGPQRETSARKQIYSSVFSAVRNLHDTKQVQWANA